MREARRDPLVYGIYIHIYICFPLEKVFSNLHLNQVDTKAQRVSTVSTELGEPCKTGEEIAGGHYEREHYEREHCI